MSECQVRLLFLFLPFSPSLSLSHQSFAVLSVLFLLFSSYVRLSISFICLRYPLCLCFFVCLRLCLSWSVCFGSDTGSRGSDNSRLAPSVFVLVIVCDYTAVSLGVLQGFHSHVSQTNLANNYLKDIGGKSIHPFALCHPSYTKFHSVTSKHNLLPIRLEYFTSRRQLLLNSDGQLINQQLSEWPSRWPLGELE